MYKLEVGMEVVLVPTDTRYKTISTAKVEKIARKWVYCERGQKFDREKFEQFGRTPIDAGAYSPSAVVYASMDRYKKEQAISKLRASVNDAFSYGGNGRSLAPEKLVQIADIIGIEHNVKL